MECICGVTPSERHPCEQGSWKNTRARGSVASRCCLCIFPKYLRSVGVRPGTFKLLDSIIQKYEISNGKRLKKIWDSPVIALSGLENDPDKLIKQITKKDPFLAAMCLNSGVKVNNDTLEFLVSELVQIFDITIQNITRNHRHCGFKVL